MSRSSKGATHVLAREPEPLGVALGEVLRRDGIELYLGMHATAARRDGDDFVLVLDDGRELRGDRLLVATGRRPRVAGLGLETAGATYDQHGVHVNAHLQAGDRLWAVGDVTGVRMLTHIGKYQGEVVADNILGKPREANYEAMPDAVYTDPQAASVGATEARFSGTAALKDVAKMGTYTRAYAGSNGFLTLSVRRRTADRRLCARARCGRVAAAGHASDPRPRAARHLARRHSAVPDVLRDLRRCAESFVKQPRTADEPIAPHVETQPAIRCASDADPPALPDVARRLTVGSEPERASPAEVDPIQPAIDVQGCA